MITRELGVDQRQRDADIKVIAPMFAGLTCRDLGGKDAGHRNAAKPPAADLHRERAIGDDELCDCGDGAKFFGNPVAQGPLGRAHGGGADGAYPHLATLVRGFVECQIMGALRWQVRDVPQRIKQWVSRAFDGNFAVEPAVGAVKRLNLGRAGSKIGAEGLREGRHSTSRCFRSGGGRAQRSS